MQILTIISALIILTTSSFSSLAGSYGGIQIGFLAPTHQELAKFYFEQTRLRNFEVLNMDSILDAMKPYENGVVSLDGFIKYYVETNKVRS